MMQLDDLLIALSGAVARGDALQARQLAELGATYHVNPISLIEHGLRPGMDIVGENFEEGVCYLPELVMSGEAMKAALAVLEPLLCEQRQVYPVAGTVVLGTVLGDIHDIGKSLVGTMLTAAGFDVVDLGVNVPTARFVQAVGDTHADIVAISALLTTTMANQQRIVEALDANGLRPRCKVLIGGAPTNAGWAQQIGADAYGATASDAVRIARRLLQGEAVR